MVLPELGSGIWTGIGFGLLGIGMWIVGLVGLRFVIGRMEDAEQPSDR